MKNYYVVIDKYVDMDTDNPVIGIAESLEAAIDMTYEVTRKVAKDLKLNSTVDVCDQFVIYSMVTGERFNPIPSRII